MRAREFKVYELHPLAKLFSNNDKNSKSCIYTYTQLYTNCIILSQNESEISVEIEKRISFNSGDNVLLCDIYILTV